MYGKNRFPPKCLRKSWKNNVFLCCLAEKSNASKNFANWKVNEAHSGAVRCVVKWKNGKKTAEIAAFTKLRFT